MVLLFPAEKKEQVTEKKYVSRVKVYDQKTTEYERILSDIFLKMERLTRQRIKR